MKPKAGTEVFELIPSQKMINFMLKYSFFHKQVIQIPMSIVTHTPIDFDVLKKALNIEIERNDCMRLRFYKEHGEFYQYFLDKYVVDDVPVVTFSTEEEQQAYLTADARRPIRHLKGEDFRIIFFRSFDGGYGIYINITHLCMDAAAVFVFFSDLLGVYDHLKNGKPMPRPLGEYKKTIRKELAIVADEKKMKEEEEFYTQFFLKDGDPLYAGVHGPELLEKSAKESTTRHSEPRPASTRYTTRRSLQNTMSRKRTVTRYSHSFSRAASAPSALSSLQCACISRR